MEQKFFSPLKTGVLLVVIAYFLFTLHATFTLSWVGEWETIGNPTTRLWILITDVVAGTFLVFRFIASAIALGSVVLYFAKKGLPQATTNKLIRIVLVFEGLYWLGLLPSGIWGVVPTEFGFNMGLLVSTGIPCLVSSIGMPIALFMTVRKLGKPEAGAGAIKWALIAGVILTVALWLNNMGVWLITVLTNGTDFLVASPELLVSFFLTLGGLLAIALFTGYFAKKSMGTQQFGDLKLGTAGAIMVALGSYFLWNYLTWILFGGWNQWYAWFLGHNLDLWMLALPLLGLALLFYRRSQNA